MKKLWAIAYDGGIFTGVAQTRSAAIAQHVWAFDEELYSAGYPYADHRALSAKQKSVWRQCRALGHRAVRVTVSIAATK